MRPILSSLLLAAILLPACRAPSPPNQAPTPPLFQGECTFDSTSGGTSGLFRYLPDPDAEHLSLQLATDPAHPQWHNAWQAEVGQTFVTSIASRLFPGIGHVLVIEADDGASSTRLVLLRPSPAGPCTTLFDGKSNFGHDIVTLRGDTTPSIIQTSGDLGHDLTIRIYKWNTHTYTLSETRHSASTPTYTFSNDAP